nr:GH25 family lysozyme [uncultured Caproiciproducens sp.]
MKRNWVALILVFAMAVSFSTTAFAAETDTAVSTLTLSSASLALKTGECATLTVSDGGNPAQGVFWSSTNPGAATVSNGLVTAVGLGRTIVTVKTADGRSAACEVHVALKGIDVSQHQGVVDWAAVKASGVDFAILRTGYGNELPETQTDTCFSTNYDNAVANGVKVGAYHVSYATTPEIAVQEAQMCLSILNGRHLGYPVFFDVEHDDLHTAMTSDQLAAIVTAFCSTITNAGYKTGLYSNASLLNTNLNSPALNAYDKWVAHYDVAAPNYSSAYTMWQYSNTGIVAGINAAVDLDYSYVNYPSGTQAPADTSILSDTGSSLTLKSGQSYQFKFTPNGISDKPIFTAGNSGVVKIVSQKLQNGSYYVKVTGVKGGTTSIYSVRPNQSPVRRCVVTVA